MREALFYERQEDGKVLCGLCRHRCLIGAGHRGICGVRENREGLLYTLVYGKAIAEHVDPVEKKPLFHFLPGSLTYSIATIGCNFRCHHCQNYSIAQPPPGFEEAPGTELPPSLVVNRAVASGCRSVSYTYTEPTIFFEYAYDTALLAKKAGLANIFVTNGYIAAEPLTHIAPCLDAVNIDLKGFTERFYREIVHGELNQVLDSILEHKRLGIWVELTTLVIPGLNDSDAELQGIARFIATMVGRETPWHVSAFHPTHRMTDRPRTPVETVRRAADIGRAAGLHHVYEGNISGSGGEDTHCPSCGELLVSRFGFSVGSNRILDGKCPRCALHIDGIW